VIETLRVERSPKKPALILCYLAILLELGCFWIYQNGKIGLVGIVTPSYPESG